MKNVFENFEIWWVTGAQLLYGGDAVVAVDGHSKEMVAGLNESGNIPVKIVYKGTANSAALSLGRPGVMYGKGTSHPSGKVVVVEL